MEPTLPPKPTNALDMIRQEVLTRTWHLEEIARFGVVDTIKQFTRYRNGKQIFAVDRYHAYDVTPWSVTDQDGYWLYEPVTTPATYLSYPDEGRSGMLEWLFSDNARYENKWHLIWGPVRWIRTKELDLSPAQIWGNICDEIDRGETPLTGGGLPGWV